MLEVMAAQAKSSEVTDEQALKACQLGQECGAASRPIMVRQAGGRLRAGDEVKDFLAKLFGRLELGWVKYVELDPRYFRPAEVNLLLGDSSKAWRKLGLESTATFEASAQMMTEAD
jgi:GDP-D-mannose dehydratase